MLEYMRTSLSITMNNDGGTSVRSGIILICTTIAVIGTTSETETFIPFIPLGEIADDDNNDDDEEEGMTAEADEAAAAATDLANMPMNRPPLDAPSKNSGSESVLNLLDDIPVVVEIS